MFSSPNNNSEMSKYHPYVQTRISHEYCGKLCRELINCFYVGLDCGFLSFLFLIAVSRDPSGKAGRRKNARVFAFLVIGTDIPVLGSSCLLAATPSN